MLIFQACFLSDSLHALHLQLTSTRHLWTSWVKNTWVICMTLLGRVSTELIPYYLDLHPTDKAHARILKSLSNHLVGSNRNHDVVISKLSKALAEEDLATFGTILKATHYEQTAMDACALVSADIRKRVFGRALKEDPEVAHYMSMHGLVDCSESYDILDKWVKEVPPVESEKYEDEHIGNLRWIHQSTQKALSKIVSGFKDADPSTVLFTLNSGRHLGGCLRRAVQSISKEEAQQFIDVLDREYYDTEHGKPEGEKSGCRSVDQVKSLLQDRMEGGERSEKYLIPKTLTIVPAKHGHTQTRASSGVSCRA